jgi:hypothetical protein
VNVAAYGEASNLAEWSSRRQAAKEAALVAETHTTLQRLPSEFVERGPDRN